MPFSKPDLFAAQSDGLHHCVFCLVLRTPIRMPLPALTVSDFQAKSERIDILRRFLPLGTTYGNGLVFPVEADSGNGT